MDMKMETHLVQRVIHYEMHTEKPAEDAVRRLEGLPSGSPEEPTGRSHAANSEDWEYGCAKETKIPLSTGLSFSRNAFVSGSCDDQALPRSMVRRLRKRRRERT
jgi:hypothetical protein